MTETATGPEGIFSRSKQRGVAGNFFRLKPGFYLVFFDSVPGKLPVLQARYRTFGADWRWMRVPALSGGLALLRLRTGEVQLAFPDDVSVTLRPFEVTDLRHLIWLRKSDYKARLDLGNVLSVMPLLAASGREGRDLKKSLSILRKFGFSVSSNNFQHTPELFDSWPPVVTHASPVARKGEAEFAVVLHLFYRELWPEFAWALGRIERPFKLFVTTDKADGEFEEALYSTFPDAEHRIVENRGRDVAPFFEWLRDGALDGFEYVCKLHAKRSAVSGPRALLGHIWRRANLVALVGSSARVDEILSRFRSDPGVGMIGAAPFHFPNEHFDEAGAWGGNRETALALAKNLGLEGDEVELDYFAGTMFWIARAPLQALKSLDIRTENFAEERGAADGELDHALERVFGLAVKAAGKRLAETKSLQEC